MGSGATKPEYPTHYDSEDSNESEGMIPEGIENWDESHDRVLSLLLSAAEFFRRKSEAEKGIMVLSGMTHEEREQYLDSVEGLMGLRAHLLDELIRIQEMLSEDDPELLRLQVFREKFPRVIGSIRIMQEQAKHITVDVNEIQLEKDDIMFSFSDEEDDNDIEESIRPGGGRPMSTRVGAGTVQRRGPGYLDVDHRPHGEARAQAAAQAEENLSKKHSSEDLEIAKNYAEKVVMRSGTISKEEIDKLLEEHALQVQTLKKKQATEKRKLKTLLNKHRSVGDTIDEDDEDDDEDGSWEETKKQLQHELWTTLQSSPDITLDDLRALLETLTPGSAGFMTERLDDNDSDSSSGSFEKTVQVGDDPASHNSTSSTGAINGVAHGQADYDANVKKMDEDFLAQMRSQAHSLINEEYAEFLRKHLEEMEKQTREASSTEPSAPDSVTETELHAEEELREEMLRKITQKENLSPEELEEILKNYRSQQTRIVKGHIDQRQLAQEKLQQKLVERRRKKEQMRQETIEKAKHAEDSFLENLESLRSSGKVSEEVFSSMVSTYMCQIASVNKLKKTQNRDKKVDNASRERATKLVQEHDKSVKQMNDMRTREKAKTDSALQRKLAEKKNQP